MAEEKNTRYYDGTDIMAIDAVYRMIIGQRTNGKTYFWCKQAIEHYFSDGLPSAYVRRLDEQLKPKLLQTLFDPQIDLIKELSGGDYNAVTYRGNAFYLIRREQTARGKREIVARDPKPFCMTFAVNTWENAKGADRGAIWSICFDEFMTRSFYLAGEFVMWSNLVISITRDRPGVNVFMIANTVNKSCPYFAEMGLYRIGKQKQGTIDVYTLGVTCTKFAVEYCATAKEVTKTVSQYFCFDNPALDMITKGGWEMALYRHAPLDLAKIGRIMLSFYVMYDDIVLQGDIYQYKKYPLIFWHFKTTEIKNPDRQIIYSQNVVDGNPLHQINMRQGFCRAQEIIYSLISQQKTFYANNETGEAVANFLKTQNLKAR